MSKSYSENHKKICIQTFGCQMNECDSERIAGLFIEQGYCLTDEVKEADLILLNTCSIRQKAEHKVYSQLGRLNKLKKEKPHLIIGVCGCIAQKAGKNVLRRMPQVDIVFGTYNLPKLPYLIKDVEQGRGRIVEITEDMESDFFDAPICRQSKVKAWVTIMHGCNNYCSYCVVPYVRGPERSRPSADIAREIKQLAEQGYKEVILLGQNVNSYGRGLGEDITFADLLYKINEIDGIERIRFVTSHPKDISDELVLAIGDLKKVCEHFHLPVQAGSNSVLKMMNRGYTIEEYRKRVEKLREVVPDISLTTDVIVGFPGETEDDFEKTIALVKELRFDNIFSFCYSSREGTKAAFMTDPFPYEDKIRRLQLLQSLQREMTYSQNKRFEGRIEEVLVEGVSKTDSQRLTGRIRTNQIVNFEGSQGLIGKLVKVKIIKGKMYDLLGELQRQESDKSKHTD